jgi:hypothetical protein
MKFLLFMSTLFLSQFSFASKCGEEIYNKRGMLTKYEYLNLTITEQTKKHGTSTSSAISTESSTAALDPGVTTGFSSGLKQSLSTNGPCKWFGLMVYIGHHRKEFIAQNMDILKNEMAKGQGEMLEMLVHSYFCPQLKEKNAQKMIQNNFVQENLAQSNAHELNLKVEKILNSGFNGQCRGPKNAV